jgi:hypothetical protein
MRTCHHSTGLRISPPRAGGTLRTGLVVALLVSACAYVGTYHPSAFDGFTSADPPLQGKVLIYSTAKDDAYVYTGHPTSWAGSANTLTLPLGEITRHAAEAAFGSQFSGGFDSANTLDAPGAHDFVIYTRVLDYRYGFNVYSGYTSAPNVQVRISVEVLGHGRSLLFKRQYDSGQVDGSTTYFIDLHPGEHISETTHTALLQVLMKAMEDMRSEKVFGQGRLAG